MGYSDDPAMMRVDFFKKSGKWYTTEAVRWRGAYQDSLIYREFAVSLWHHLHKSDGTLRMSAMVAVCLEPHHEHAHPLMLAVDEIHERMKEA